MGKPRQLLLRLETKNEEEEKGTEGNKCLLKKKKLEETTGGGDLNQMDFPGPRKLSWGDGVAKKRSLLARKRPVGKRKAGISSKQRDQRGAKPKWSNCRLEREDISGNFSLILL